MSDPVITDEEINDVLAWANLEFDTESNTQDYQGRTEEAIRALLETQRRRLDRWYKR